MAALYLSKQTSAPVPEVSQAPAEVPLPMVPHSQRAAPTTTTSPDMQVSTGELPLLGPHLRTIGDCLKINNAMDPNADLSLNSLNSSLRNDLGEQIEGQLDWRNVHIQLPNGEKRRLRFEVEAIGEETAGTRLKYYGVDKEDLPVPLTLSDEQSLNPSSSFVASLESEGQVTLREEAHRGVYSSGAELYYVERNGALSEFEINFHDKSVKCQDLQSAQGNCSCF